MTSFMFFVPGLPVGQPRPRLTRRGVFNPDTADKWKQCVAWAARPIRPGSPIACPLRLELHFWMPRPKVHFLKGKLRPTAPRWCATKPDFDNLAKAVADALTDCRFWLDDDQVVEAVIAKRYVVEDGAPGCTVTIEPLIAPL